ncbi:hypothetical protein GOV05_05840 [Candidatus Woesearchaeota archaeon]|nr:hypothetical protein [Candidatus Woesearchaeota archaeon]
MKDLSGLLNNLSTETEKIRQTVVSGYDPTRKFHYHVQRFLIPYEYADASIDEEGRNHLVLSPGFTLKQDAINSALLFGYIIDIDGFGIVHPLAKDPSEIYFETDIYIIARQKVHFEEQKLWLTVIPGIISHRGTNDYIREYTLAHIPNIDLILEKVYTNQIGHNTSIDASLQ